VATVCYVWSDISQYAPIVHRNLCLQGTYASSFNFRPTFSVHTMVRDCLSVSTSHLLSYSWFSFRFASRLQLVAASPLKTLLVGIPLDFRSYQRRDERRERSRPQIWSSNHWRRDSLRLQRRIRLSSNYPSRYPALRGQQTVWRMWSSSWSN